MKTKRKRSGALALGAAGLIAVGVIGSSATSAEAVTLVGTVHEHRDYGGASLDYQASKSGYVCTQTMADVDVQWPGPYSIWWDNRVSSFRVSASCWARIWDGRNFTGANLGFTSSTPFVGSAMNDKMSSIQFS